MEKIPAEKPYRIVFFGTSDFAVPVLERLRADGDFDIRAVVTQPDRPVGRSQVLARPPVKRAAETFGLPVLQPETMRGSGAEETLRKLDADLFVIVAYGQILPRSVLELAPSGCVNVHGSLLPSYRGASPISAAIAAGETETGVTVMLMDERLDTGPILATTRETIREDDTTGTLALRLSQAGAEMLGPTLKLYLSGALAPTPQDDALATMTRTLKKEDARVDWTKSAASVERLVRAMKPWPEASTTIERGGRKLKLTLREVAVLHPESPCDAVGRPGSVCRLADGTMGVNCGSGSLTVKSLQLEGKKETDGKSFLNGYPDAVGATLG